MFHLSSCSRGRRKFLVLLIHDMRLLNNAPLTYLIDQDICTFFNSNFIVSVSKPHFNVPNFDLQSLLINIEETETMKLLLMQMFLFFQLIKCPCCFAYPHGAHFSLSQFYHLMYLIVAPRYLSEMCDLLYRSTGFPP